MSKHPDGFFAEPGEFVDEIVRAHARGLVERGICARDEGRPAGDERHDYARDGRVVRLRHPVGELWGLGGDEQVQTCASEVVRALESALLDGGLELRAGIYDED